MILSFCLLITRLWGIRFLVSIKYFSSQVFEYAVTDQIIPNQQLLSLEQLIKESPAIDLSQLNDTEGTLKLLQKVGLL